MKKPHKSALKAVVPAKGKTVWTTDEAIKDWKHERRVIRRYGGKPPTFGEWCERLALYGYKVIFPGGRDGQGLDADA